MDHLETLEKRNKRTGILVSIGVHCLLILIFYFLFAWTTPDPPIPEFGIEIGLSASSSSSNENPIPAQQSSPKQDDSVEEEVKQDAEEPVEPEEAEVAEEVEETTNTTAPAEEVVTEDLDSPDVSNIEEEVSTQEKVLQEEEIIEEELEESKTTQEEDAPLEKVDEEGVKATESQEVVNDSPAEAQEVDERALYSGGTSDATGSGAANTGAMLDLSGWSWDFEPDPKDESTENGKIVFEIKVNDEGEILNVRTVSTTVSPSVERIYKDAVRDLTFSKTAQNRTSAAISTGRITFTIKSQ